MPYIVAFIFSQMLQFLNNSFIRKYIITEYLFNSEIDSDDQILDWDEPPSLESLFLKWNVGVTKYSVSERLKSFLTKICIFLSKRLRNYDSWL